MQSDNYAQSKYQKRNSVTKENRCQWISRSKTTFRITCNSVIENLLFQMISSSFGFQIKLICWKNRFENLRLEVLGQLENPDFLSKTRTAERMMPSVQIEMESLVEIGTESVRMNW